MIYISKLLWINLIFIMMLPLIKSESDESLGCTLIPSTTGTHVEQDTLLNYLRLSLFGKRYTCSSHVASSKYEYHFRVCGDVLEDKKKAFASVVRTSLLSGASDAIGRRNVTSLAGKKGEWILMKLGNGDNETTGPCANKSLSSSVMILCDRDYSSPEFTLLYQEDSYCHFMFELKTSSICEIEGLGGWAIFFLIVLFGFIAYFAAGCIYLKFVVGANGVNIVPHRQFWLKLGNKLADICNVLCRCQPCCGDELDGIHSSHSSGYSPIGENSPTMGSHSSQKDAPLLHP